MNRFIRAAEIILILIVFIIFAFVFSFGTFVVKKEFDCSKGLMTDACFRTYPQFLERLAHFQW